VDGTKIPGFGFFPGFEDIRKWATRKCCMYELVCKDTYEIRNGLKLPAKLCYAVPRECKKVPLGFPCPNGYRDLGITL
jgi:hypothetical protein